MENTKKRVAVIGYGGMGGWHVKYIQASDVVELAGICDIKESQINKAIERGIHVYKSIDEAIADPTVDILTLAVPNELHMPMAVKALKAGKNVISEKPVTMSSTDLQKMIDAANESGKLFTNVAQILDDRQIRENAHAVGTLDE